MIAHYTEGKRMAISYNGLWKQLIDHGMKKGDLCEKTGFGDLIDYVPDEKEKFAE